MSATRQTKTIKTGHFRFLLRKKGQESRELSTALPSAAKYQANASKERETAMTGDSFPIMAALESTSLHGSQYLMVRHSASYRFYLAGKQMEREGILYLTERLDGEVLFPSKYL